MSGSSSTNRIVGTGLGSIGLTLDLRIGPHLLRYWNLHSCAIPPTTEGRSGEEPTSPNARRERMNRRTEPHSRERAVPYPRISTRRVAPGRCLTGKFLVLSKLPGSCTYTAGTYGSN